MAEHRYGGSRDVPIAEFLYRHEAEFAAGFLRSAEIPFRLQVDDAGGADAGVTIARPAVLWVRAEDAEEARELLDLEGPAASSTVVTTGARTDGNRREAWTGEHESLAPAPDPSPREQAPAGLASLCRAERLVAGLLALVLFALAASGGQGAVPWVGFWEGVALLLALVLGLSAVSGRTIRSVKAVLRTLSGLAP